MTPYDTVRPLDQPRGWWLQILLDAYWLKQSVFTWVSCERWPREWYLPVWAGVTALAPRFSAPTSNATGQTSSLFR